MKTSLTSPLALAALARLTAGFSSDMILKVVGEYKFDVGVRSSFRSAAGMISGEGNPVVLELLPDLPGAEEHAIGFDSKGVAYVALQDASTDMAWTLPDFLAEHEGLERMVSHVIALVEALLIINEREQAAKGKVTIDLRGGYTEDQIRDAFAMVKPKDNWKNPVDVVLPDPGMDMVKLISFAVRYHTGSELVVTPARKKGHLRFRAAGYYMSIGG